MRVHCSLAGKSEQLSEALGLGETELLGNWECSPRCRDEKQFVLTALIIERNEVNSDFKLLL